MNAIDERAEEQRELVREFNAKYAVGSPVEVWPGAKELGKPLHTKTRSKAQLLGGHTAVVWVEGHSGCISLSQIRPINE